MHFITAYYKFIPITDLEHTKEFFLHLCESTDTKGLVILAPEGFNSTVSNTSAEALARYKERVLEHFKLDSLNFKDAESAKAPFRRLSIKIRPEIVTSGNKNLVPPLKNHHLSPDEWNRVMQEEKPVIIDTRNWYEYKIGTFEGALNPNTEKFTDFPKYMNEQKISKSEKILIFCTGGIRCEKGLLELQEKGYDQVYQLDGGILNYLKVHPNEKFKGECFVFDHRVAVDQKLNPSTVYKLCPHCGQPGQTPVICERCDTPTSICESCATLPFKQATCSKNCAHHFEIHPERKAARQIPHDENGD